MSTQLTVIIVVTIVSLTFLLSQAITIGSEINLKKQDKSKILTDVIILAKRIENEENVSLSKKDIVKELKDIYYRN